MSDFEASVQIDLLGEFALTISGERCPLPMAAARLVAVLALRPCGLDREALEEQLWPDASRGRSSANLRSALWKVRQWRAAPVIASTRTRLRVSDGISTDMHQEAQRVRRLLASEQVTGSRPGGIGRLALGLLPGWRDDWLLLERERWDQVRLHGLEALARWHLAKGEYLTALEASIAAVELEPYRESAQRILIQIHIAEGNNASALRQYQRFRGLLQRELGVPPTPQLYRLVQPLTLA